MAKKCRTCGIGWLQERERGEYICDNCGIRITKKR